ncbi:uncharacterized protein OCT59_024334 [Rhizophagus irregularis]|uniref:uncharacterized protein n=1 Tax=Rhizophagus irregularis TaxID=588596 RepID=UPI00332D78A8|nr:hypothetical protein OCT59_024334 [Rhizophagus irregularis]
MIANITTIVYILSVTDETINNSVLQKGMAISRIDNEDAFQIYKFYNYMTLINNTDLDSDDGSEVTSPLKAENVYLITGKFSTTQDGSINVSITTNVQLLIDKEDIPIIKPTDQFTPFTVNLTHPPNGRFKNALTKARKNSTVHTTGVFFFAKDQLYCEILEFQFVSAKIESDNSIVVPWKSKSDSLGVIDNDGCVVEFCCMREILCSITDFEDLCYYKINKVMKFMIVKFLLQMKKMKKELMKILKKMKKEMKI